MVLQHALRLDSVFVSESVQLLLYDLKLVVVVLLVRMLDTFKSLLHISPKSPEHCLRVLAHALQ